MPTPPADEVDFDAQAAARKKAQRRAFAIIFGVFALLAACFGYAFIADEEPPDTSDLHVTFLHPPEEKNAYALLTKLVATLPPLPEDDTPESKHFGQIFSDKPEDQVAWNQDVVATVLGRYPPNLADSVRAALEAPECEAPETKSFADSIPEVGRYRSLTYILTRHATLAWHSGDHEKAANLNLLVLTFGSRINQSKGSLITVLTGTAIKGIGLAAIERHADSESITANALRTYLEQIGQYETRIQDYHTAYRLEHVVFANMARDLKNQHVSGLLDSSFRSSKVLDSLMTLPGIWQPNVTIRWHAEYIRTQIAQTEPIPRGAPNPAATEFMTKIESSWPQRAQNITGRVLLAIVTPTLGAVTTTHHRSRASIRLTQIYVALRLHQLDHNGALPDDLTELVPAYLPAIPLDPFDGQPLRYDRSLTTIWSIGPNNLHVTQAEGALDHRYVALRLRFARPVLPLPSYEEYLARENPSSEPSENP